MGKNSKHKLITFHTKDGVFIAFPPDSKGKLSIKAERTAKGQMTSVGYFDVHEKEWHILHGMNLPFGVKSVIEEQYA